MGILYIERKTIYKRGLFILLFFLSFFLKKKVKGLRSHTACAAQSVFQLGLTWEHSWEEPLHPGLCSLTSNPQHICHRACWALGPGVNSTLGEGKDRTEALSEFPPCPGRALYCTHPNIPTCVTQWILGKRGVGEVGKRGNHCQDPVITSLSRPSTFVLQMQTVPH